MRWQTLWPPIKDVVLTGTGIFLILSQVFDLTPSSLLLVTGLALTTPALYGHTVALLSGDRGSGGPPSPSSPQPGPPPSTSSPPKAGTGEPR